MTLFSDAEIQSFKTVFDASDKILITVHQYPDLDAIGSAIALYEQCLAHQKEAHIWIADTVPKYMSFLNYVDIIQSKKPDFSSFDTFFVLDCSDYSRVAHHKQVDWEQSSPRIVNIDHHPDNSMFGHINLVKNISSVGEMLSHLFQQLAWPLTENSANALFSAIRFDTGSFSHANVTPTTFNILQWLVNFGARPHFIAEQMDDNKTVDDFKVLQIGLERMVVHESNFFVYTSLPNHTNSPHIKLIDYIRQLEGPSVALVFQSIGGTTTKVSLRSKSNFSVSLFAKQFDGGGHHRAAGLVIESPLDLAIKRVTSALDSAHQKGLFILESE